MTYPIKLVEFGRSGLAKAERVLLEQRSFFFYVFFRKRFFLKTIYLKSNIHLFDRFVNPLLQGVFSFKNVSKMDTILLTQWIHFGYNVVKIIKRRK